MVDAAKIKNRDNINLLGNLNRIETPFVKITIGKYVFGVYDRKTSTSYKGGDETRIAYPNYIQSLQVKKINGKVNQYTLQIKYPIADGSDPNFFEKVFSSVSKTREIVFSYGDLSVPNFIYKDEKAIILNVKTKMNAQQSVIDYTVTAVSSIELLTAVKKDFQGGWYKPSDRIKWLLKNNDEFGLADIFFGMRDYRKVIMDKLIADDDQEMMLEYKENCSILDYLNYLVNSMISTDNKADSSDLSSLYSLIIYDDVSGRYDGPYFRVKKMDKYQDFSDAYVIDIGYPSENIVTEFNVDSDDSYSIIYNYASEVAPEEYAWRINRQGELERVYAPVATSANDHYETMPEDRTWWSKVTSFPIKATITLKGLLRPALLMTHVRLNVYYYGKKHVSSGLYVITQQIDNIGLNGYKTTLSLLKIMGDDDVV